MRVLELKPVVTQTMGKKKHKLRKQSKENKLCPGSDSSDEAALQGATAGQGCTHLNKSINFATMKKSIKQQASIGECTSCTRDAAAGKNEARSITPPPTGLGAAPLAEEESLLDAAEQTIWVCLQCGHQGCDRNSKEKHALKHYQTPRSSSHAVTVNINTWSIWCYDCDDEVFVDSSKKLVECVEFLRKQCGMGRPDSAAGRPSSRAENPVQDSVEGSTTKDEKPKLQQQKSVKQQTSSLVLPKVKGLSNLGNTCFFNAVMQNLSQTPGLEGVILERNKKHIMETIPAATVVDSEEELESEGEEEEDPAQEEQNGHSRLHLTTLEINLPESGALTQSLLNFLTDMNNPTKNSVISPNSLFGHVCRKAPRFKGFQQQDSHELLRHLLDGMKAEEVKRSQRGILKSFGLSENPNPKKLDDLTKKKIKEYGRLVKSTFVDTIFGGYFISTVLCEECRHPSQIFEPFLDISLPITEEKPLRPNSIWGSRKKDAAKPASSGSLGIATLTTSKSAVEGFTEVPSKHLSKKAKKAARKEAKRKGKRGKSISEEPENDGDGKEQDKEANGAADGSTKDGPVVNGDSHSNNDEEWDSKSDADVEDNIESDVVKSRYINGTPSEGTRGMLPGENNLIQKISQSKMTLINGVAFSANGVVVETTNRMSKSDSELCTQATSGAKRSDSNFDVDSLTTSISSMGIGNDTSTLRSVSTEDIINHRGMVNGFDSDEITLNDGMPSAKSEVGVKTEAAENNHDGATSSKLKNSAITNDDTTTMPKPGKSRAERYLEMKVKATSTLVPRYHPVGHECSILSCLNQFSAMELLTGNNKFGCEKCTLRKHGKQNKEGKKETVYTNASKQVLIFSPPPVLTLHLKRFQQVGFSLRKVNRHVDFPLMLDLAPFCSSMAQGLKRGQTQVLYSLYGVVEHSGRLNNGHYTAYVKVRPKSEKIVQFISSRGTNGVKLHKLLEAMASVNEAQEGEDGKKEAAEGGVQEAAGASPGAPGVPGAAAEHRDEEKEESSRSDSPPGHQGAAPPPGRWFYISDSRVNEISESAVLKSQAYILFYERIL